VSLAKQALHNLPHFQESQSHFGLNDIEFRREFGTVKIAMPRQSGHSTAALQLMYEYPDAICFVPNGSVRNFTCRLLRDYTDDKEVLNRIDANIMVPGESTMARIRPQWERSFIIIDQALQMRKESTDLIVASLQASIILELA